MTMPSGPGSGPPAAGGPRRRLISILADRVRAGAVGPGGPGRRPVVSRPLLSAPHGSIGSAGRKKITGERATTVCFTPTCTSTPDSPAPAAGTATSSTSHGGRAAKGSRSSAPVTLPTRRGRMSCGSLWSRPSPACSGSPRTPKSACGAVRPPVAAARCGSCFPQRFPRSTAAASGQEKCTIFSTRRHSKPPTASPARYRRSVTWRPTAGRFWASSRDTCSRSRLTAGRAATWFRRTPGPPGLPCWDPNPASISWLTATAIWPLMYSRSRPGCPPIRP